MSQESRRARLLGGGCLLVCLVASQCNHEVPIGSYEVSGSTFRAQLSSDYLPHVKLRFIVPENADYFEARALVNYRFWDSDSWDSGRSVSAEMPKGRFLRVGWQD
jgi:hypothetical protein